MFGSYSNIKVRVGQIVEGGEMILLDAIDVATEAGEETVVELDITHAVHGWVDNPNTNLGLRVIFDQGSDLPQLVSPPSIIVDTQHSFVAPRRSKRSVSALGNIVDYVPRIPGDSDCPENQEPFVITAKGKKKRPTCCR